MKKKKNLETAYSCKKKKKKSYKQNIIDSLEIELGIIDGVHKYEINIQLYKNLQKNLLVFIFLLLFLVCQFKSIIL